MQAITDRVLTWTCTPILGLASVVSGSVGLGQSLYHHLYAQWHEKVHNERQHGMYYAILEKGTSESITLITEGGKMLLPSVALISAIYFYKVYSANV